MTRNATPDDRQLALAPLDEKVDHVRGSPAGHLIIEYGDYECPYSRQAFHAIERVEQQLGGNMRFAFRHFPLTGIHPHALAAAAAAEAAARQGRFWDMHELLFHRQKALEDGHLRGYASQLGLDVVAFDSLDRVERLPRVRALVIAVLDDQVAGGRAADMIDLLIQRRQGQLAVVRRCVASHGHLLAPAGRSGPAAQKPTCWRMRTMWMRPGSSWWISRILPTWLCCP